MENYKKFHSLLDVYHNFFKEFELIFNRNLISLDLKKDNFSFEYKILMLFYDNFIELKKISQFISKILLIKSKILSKQVDEILLYEYEIKEEHPSISELILKIANSFISLLQDFMFFGDNLNVQNLVSSIQYCNHFDEGIPSLFKRTIEKIEKIYIFN